MIKYLCSLLATDIFLRGMHELPNNLYVYWSPSSFGPLPPTACMQKEHKHC